MTTGGKKWQYHAVKQLPTLFKGLISSHDGDFYCFHCFHSFRTENKLKSMKMHLKIMFTTI